MFGLFKKKKEDSAPEAAAPAAEAPAREQSQEYRDFAAAFLPEETDITAVTGAAVFGQEPVGDTGLWKITIGLTAWMDDYTHELRQGEATLEAMVDQKLLEYLLTRTPRNFIISVTVRPARTGDRFMMTDLPKPGFDPDLKAILEEQKKPVTLEVEGLGTFTLSRNLGWFENTVDWCGSEISLTFDQAEETRTAAQDTARALMSEQAQWDERVRGYAADTLLDRANDLLAQEDGGEPISRQKFLDQLALDSVLTAPDGAFEFWFSGDDLFLAHPVHVTGTLENGPESADLSADEE